MSVEFYEKRVVLSPLKNVNGSIVRFDGLITDSISLFIDDDSEEYIASIDYSPCDDVADVMVEINWSKIYTDYMTSYNNLFSECDELNDIMAFLKQWLDNAFSNIYVNDASRFMYGEKIESIIDDLTYNVNAFPNINVLLETFEGTEFDAYEFSGKTYYYKDPSHYGIIFVTVF